MEKYTRPVFIVLTVTLPRIGKNNNAVISTHAPVCHERVTTEWITDNLSNRISFRYTIQQIANKPPIAIPPNIHTYHSAQANTSLGDCKKVNNDLSQWYPHTVKVPLSPTNTQTLIANNIAVIVWQIYKSHLPLYHMLPIMSKPNNAVIYDATLKSKGKACHITCKQSTTDISPISLY